MAQITRVKKAQQRYEMVPVLNPDGSQKQTPVMKNGVQATTRTGRLVFMDVTVADKTKPLPNASCGKCGKEIEVGQPYKHISPRSGPYGGRRLVRCAACPDWMVWEYSSSLSARLAEVEYDFSNALGDVSTTDEVQDALNEAAARVREIAEEKRESASSIEDGFGHETSQSAELNDIADSLDSWADEIESADIPELPDTDDLECENCEGSGKTTNDEGDESEDCSECEGTGHPTEPPEDAIDEWRSEVQGDLTIVGEPPV